MGLAAKRTSATNIQKALKHNLVTVGSVIVASKDDHRANTVPAEQFKDDLDFYLESGIFADSIDFKYGLHDNNLTIYAGNMSSYCDNCITVHFAVNDGMNKKELENVIKGDEV